jgi:type I restriction enzyme, S subunit
VSDWPVVRLRDVCEKITDGTHHSPPNGARGDYKYITAKNIKPWGLDLSYVSYVDSKTHHEIFSRCDAKKGDILYVKDGATTGRLTINPLDEPFSLLSSVAVLRAGPAVRTSYLAYALQDPETRDRMLAATAGVAITRLTLRKLGDAVIPLAPLACQDRVVEKLDELLSDLDAGVAELKAAQRKLAQFRQSLLKAAVDGTLTADWRAARLASLSPRVRRAGRTGVREAPATWSANSRHPLPIPSPGMREGVEAETGAELLQRILAERRSRWEQKQLARFAEQGKTPPKGWQSKYPEPVAPDTDGLPELPEGWAWATIDQVASVGTGVTPLKSNRAYFQGGSIPWVTSGALNDEVVTSASAHVTERAMLECRLELYPAGALLVAMYGEGKTRGKCAELGIPATINQAIAAIVFDGVAELSRAHVKTFLLDAYEAMRKKASGGVQPNLNLQIIKQLVIPLPSASEQALIRERLSEFLAKYCMMDVAVSLAHAQAAAQRKNLLRAAFAGQLVPQDPSDEPASELLARIRASRDAERAGVAPRRGRRSKARA